MHAAAGLGMSYLFLLLFSTLIATFGLLSNSAGTVIGAMNVAPLMGPILGICIEPGTGGPARLWPGPGWELNWSV